MSPPSDGGAIAEERPPQVICAAIEANAELDPAKRAIRDRERELSYSELLEESWAIAAQLAALQLAPGDAIATMLDNHCDYVAATVGIMYAACVEVPINTAFKGESLRYVLAQAEVRAVVVEAQYVERVAALISELPLLKVIVVRGVSAPPAFGPDSVAFSDLLQGRPDPLPAPSPSDVAAIMFTSGTTGPSKGVIAPHGHLFRTASMFPFTSSADTALVQMPFFHIGGRCSQVFNSLVAGGTACILPWFSASNFWNDVREFGATTTLLVGVMTDFLMQQPAVDSDSDNPLRTVITVPTPSYIEEFRRRFGIEEVQTGFGMTEVNPVFRLRLGDTKSCGTPCPDLEVRLVDDADREVPLGEPGELLVRTREPWSALQGYYGMPQASLDAFRNLWFHTGDVFVRDAEDRFYFVDRKKDSLRRRGENISSFEVERQILAVAPTIREVAVVAVPSEWSEDEIMAVVSVMPGAELDLPRLFKDLADALPYFMVPRYFEVLDDLPKTATNKISKTELRRAGLTPTTWDAQAAGLYVTRHGVSDRPTTRSAQASDAGEKRSRGARG